MEQSRQQDQSSSSGATAAVSAPADNASFFHNLTPELRRTILADVDESVILHLPEEVASEARALQQERETRRRHILEQRHAVLERIFEQASGGEPGAGYLPPHTWDPSGYRYAILNLNPQHIVDSTHHRLGNLYHHFHSVQPSQSSKGEFGSKQMLDQEALTCLLVLLFFDQNRLHTNRLHRILKNLSQHLPTRAWIFSSLLAILREAEPNTHSLAISHTCPMPPPLTPSSSSQVSTTRSGPRHRTAAPHWLNLSINAALGSHAQVFHFQQTGKIGSNFQIHIHPLASSQICTNVIELLVFLSRQFPASFLPFELMPIEKLNSIFGAGELRKGSNQVVSNFWHILLRLDGAENRKGKGSLKNFQFYDPGEGYSTKELFSRSTIGQLMMLLQHRVVKGSHTLTDRLLRILSVSSGCIPKNGLLKQATESTPLSQQQQPPPKGAADLKVLGSTKSKSDSPGPPSSASASATASAADDVFDVEDEVVDRTLLQIVITVLTHGQCSEDGLEDATQLLTNLSKCSIHTRRNILYMLVEGIILIGDTLCMQIAALEADLTRDWEALKWNRSLNFPSEEQQEDMATTPETSASVLTSAAAPPSQSGSAAMSSTSTGGAVVGSLAPRTNVIPGIVLPSLAPESQSVDHSKDLHLPTMIPLTCKGSQQSFFLRMLKVVCQLRESAMAGLLGPQKPGSEEGGREGERRM